MKRPELHSHMAGTCCTLAGLPETVLHQIFTELSAQDLAALAMQDQYLRMVAADSALWEPLALARWPGADADEQYSGNWHALFMARARMPHAFPLAADRVRVVTAAQRQRQQEAEQQPGTAAGAAAAGALPQLAFEDVMRQVFAVGSSCSGDRSVRRTAEWRGLKADLTWWATQRPEFVVAFIRSAHEALAAGGSSRAWQDTPWRRSAVAFLEDLGLLTGTHASVVNRIAAEAAALDREIRRAQKAAGAEQAPQGVPTAHWWFA